MAKNKLVRGTCTVQGCSRPHKLRGYCAAHAQRFRRGVDVNVTLRQRDMTPKEHCSEAGCLSPVKAKGLCQMHYARLLRHGFVHRPNRKKPRGQCSLIGCGCVVYAGGLCNRHYLRRRAAARHGLSLSDVEQILAKQDGVCAVCQQETRSVNAVSGKIADFAIDHCHKTMAVRGLLCSHCNRGLGLFQDSPEILRRAAAYLESHST